MFIYRNTTSVKDYILVSQNLTDQNVNSQPTCEKVSKTSLLITNFSQNQKKVIRIFLHMYTVLRFKNDIQCSTWR